MVNFVTAGLILAVSMLHTMAYTSKVTTEVDRNPRDTTTPFLLETDMFKNENSTTGNLDWKVNISSVLVGEDMPGFNFSIKLNSSETLREAEELEKIESMDIYGNDPMVLFSLKIRDLGPTKRAISA